MAIDVISLGCRLNRYEGEVMGDLAAQAGLDNAVVINSCAVTAEAVRQSRQALRKARRQHPDAKLIVTGCAAQLEPDEFAAMPEVDAVIGNQEKMQAKSFQQLAKFTQNASLQVTDIMTAKETAHHLLDGFKGRARAFLQIQQGCDHRCTFCIIPFARGPSRSVALGPILEQARKLLDNGYQELVLTGVDISDYGKDLPGRPTLGNLVRRLLRALPHLPRLRLSSVDSIEVDDSLLAAFAEEERLMPHLHLSLQAGDDMILKRMKRRHRRADAVQLCQRLKELRPDIVFGADLIAGFPTETEAMFANSRALIEDCELTYLHVFPFSARQGTPAARMPAVPAALVKKRAAILREKGAVARQHYLSAQIGRQHNVLVERPGFGHSAGMAPMRVPDAWPVGQVQTAIATGCDEQGLVGAAA